jgi:hypothetical protein
VALSKVFLGRVHGVLLLGTYSTDNFGLRLAYEM